MAQTSDLYLKTQSVQSKTNAHYTEAIIKAFK